MGRTDATKAARLARTAAFAVALALPTAGGIMRLWSGPSGGTVPDRRFSLVGMHERHPSAVLNACREWFDASIRPFRYACLGAFIRIKANLLGVSPHPRIVLGRDGWLFLGRESERGKLKDIDLATDIAGLRPLSRQSLEAWRIALESRRDWCEAKGAAYVFLLCPNKQTVYPEHLPPHMACRDSDRTRRRAFLDHMRAHSDLVIHDATPALLAAKAKRQVYYRTDTHWNGHGAFEGFRALALAAAQVFPRLREPTPDQFSVYEKPVVGGDLAQMLASAAAHRETAVAYRAREQRAWPPAAQPVVVFCDSFIDGMRPFLDAVAPGAAYRPGHMDFTPGEAANANGPAKLVVQQTVERYLMLPPPTNAAEVTAAHCGSKPVTMLDAALPGQSEPQAALDFPLNVPHGSVVELALEDAYDQPLALEYARDDGDAPYTWRVVRHVPRATRVVRLAVHHPAAGARLRILPATGRR
jgi:hypothetical protein